MSIPAWRWIRRGRLHGERHVVTVTLFPDWPAPFPYYLVITPAHSDLVCFTMVHLTGHGRTTASWLTAYLSTQKPRMKGQDEKYGREHSSKTHGTDKLRSK